MSAFTPGPWTMDGRLVIDSSGDAIAMVNIARPVDAAHCDARLIAASPDFADAAQGYVDWTARFGDEIPESTLRAIESAFGAKLRAALAKAGGAG